MKIVLKNKSPEDILISTIRLTSYKETDEAYIFYCYKCGHSLAQISGFITNVSAGFVPNESALVINRCKNSACKENYVFQTSQALNPPYTKLELVAKDKINYFHCVVCRTRRLQYNKDSVVLLAPTVLHAVPFRFNCIEPDCLHSYKLTDICYNDV